MVLELEGASWHASSPLLASRCMKARKALQRAVRYIRVDLPEIVFPSSIPDPPDYVPPKPVTWKLRWQALRAGTRDYLDSWKSPEPETGEDSRASDDRQKESSLLDDITATARTSTSLKPVIARAYESYVAVFQESLTNFIEGYREGVAQKMSLMDLLPREAEGAEPLQSRGNAQAGQPSADTPAVSTELQGERFTTPPATTAADAAPRSSLRQPEGEMQELHARGSNLKPEADSSLAASESSPELRTEQDVKRALAARLKRRAPSETQERYSNMPPADASVAEALDEAESIASGLLGGEVGYVRRRDLERAIARVEAAMRAITPPDKN